jgi:hypothetical protein
MATGDIKVTVQIEGGDAKTATIPSATRVNALAWMNRDRGSDDTPDLTDATYSVHIANSAANGIIHAAEKQITLAAKPSTPTFTAAE